MPALACTKLRTILISSKEDFAVCGVEMTQRQVLAVAQFGSNRNDAQAQRRKYINPMEGLYATDARRDVILRLDTGLRGFASRLHIHGKMLVHIESLCLCGETRELKLSQYPSLYSQRRLNYINVCTRSDDAQAAIRLWNSRILRDAMTAAD